MNLIKGERVMFSFVKLYKYTSYYVNNLRNAIKRERKR